MRRMILVLTVLAFAMPTMAGVTITAVNEGLGIPTDPNIGVVRIDYASDANVSAFALEIEFSNGATVNDVNDYFIGESNSTGLGFGIFLDQSNGISITPIGDILDYGTPIVHSSSPNGVGTGRRKSKVILEMGALYEDGNQPPLSGTLCRIYYRSDCNATNMTISGNARRGNIVLEDATEASTNLPITLVGLADTNGIAYLLDVTDMNQAIAEANIVAAGFEVGNVTTDYNDTIADGNVISQSPAGDAILSVCTPVDLLISLGPGSPECLTAGHMTPDYGPSGLNMGGNPDGAYSDYADWLAVDEPNCWCISGPPEANPRQCWGDADKHSEGNKNFWVATEDLNTLLAGWRKKYVDMAGQTYAGLWGPVPWICADYDHFGEGNKKFRVGVFDLNIMLSNWRVKNLPVPDCP